MTNLDELLAEIAARGRLGDAITGPNGKVSGVTCHNCGKPKADVSLNGHGLQVGCFVWDALMSRDAYVESFKAEYGDIEVGAPVLTVSEYAAQRFPTVDP